MACSMFNSRLLRPPLGPLVCVAAVVFGVIVAARTLGWLQGLELRAYDALLQIRAAPAQIRAAPAAEAGPVLIVAAGDREIQTLRWPLSDDLLAAALERLLALEPVVIGVDIYRDAPVGDGARLDALLRRDPRVVWVDAFADGVAIPAPAAVRGTSRTGFADLPLDPDNIVRKGLLFLDDGETTQQSFAFALAARYLAAHGVQPRPGVADPAHMRLGSAEIAPFEADDGGYSGADAGGYQVFLDFPFGQPRFPVVPLQAVLDGAVSAEAVAGRVVLLGVRARTVKDVVLTPFDRDAARLTYGVALQGEIVAQLIRHGLEGARPLQTLSPITETGAILLAAVIGAAIALMRCGVVVFAVVLSGALALTAWIAVAAFAQALWLPAAPAALALLGAAGFGAPVIGYLERRDRNRLMRLFSRHVSGAVAEEIWRRRDAFADGGRPTPRTLTAAVLFVDIQDYTRTTERMAPADVVAWLDRFFEAVTPIVRAHGGVVDKFIGDAMMAVFGAPLSSGDPAADARAAAAASLAMGARLDDLNRALIAEELPPIAIRVGVHSGTVVAGVVGGAERAEYTVIGDAVNVAARLERLAADLAPPPEAGARPDCAILISDAFRALLGADFKFEPVGPVQLKGKRAAIVAHRLIAAAPSRPVGGDEPCPPTPP